jgi:hypothetical protein
VWVLEPVRNWGWMMSLVGSVVQPGPRPRSPKLVLQAQTALWDGKWGASGALARLHRFGSGLSLRPPYTVALGRRQIWLGREFTAQNGATRRRIEYRPSLRLRSPPQCDGNCFAKFRWYRCLPG